MNLRFSRSSLNLIIFICIILIGWASIDKNRSVESPTKETISLPTLSDLKQQTWSSREGIQVVWQTRLDTDFQIRIRGQIPESDESERDTPENRASANRNLDATAISWQQDYWQWDINIGEDFELGLSQLNQQINNFPAALKGQPAAMILQGPWGADIARITSARLIKSLALKPLTALGFNTATKRTTQPLPPIHTCPWQPVSAQFWLQDQLSSAKHSRADSMKKQWWVSSWPELAPINEQSLQVWKQTFVQQWQLNWQNPVTQFDILADLAYYRLPQNYLLEGYWGINTLDVEKLERYLSQCQIHTLEQDSEPAEHLGSISHGEKEKQQ
jgi:hypothetical protein